MPGAGEGGSHGSLAPSPHPAQERGRPGLDPPSGKDTPPTRLPRVGTWAIKSGLCLWSLFFISAITFMASDTRGQPPPPRLSP